MRHVRGAFAIFPVAAVLVVAGCGGGGGGATTGTEPAGWKRCASTHHGFSIAYPGSWHIATYERLEVLGHGAAYRRHFLASNICLNYHPRPFTVYDATEGPQTAVTVWRLRNAREFRRELHGWFRQPYVRTIERHAVVVRGHRAVRFHVYLRPGAPLTDRSHVYGYLIDFGHRGGLVVEAWRYGFEPISWKQFRTNMALVDRMAPTARVAAS